jgi:hypothetical protein
MDSPPPLKGLKKLPKLVSKTSAPQLVRTGDFSHFPSPKFIEGSRVGSCNKVIMKKGKQSTAIPFYTRKVHKNSVPSSFFTSWSHDIHTMHVNEHAGMLSKHLIPYHPEAMRNRLQNSDTTLLRKNSSQF